MKITTYSYIKFVDSPKEAHFIHKADEISNALHSITKDHILNIKGLGRLKVMNIIQNLYTDEFDSERAYHEFGIIVIKIDNYWNIERTAVAKWLTDEIITKEGVRI